MRDNPVTIPASGAIEFDCAGSVSLLCDSSSLASFRVIIDGTKSFSFKEGRKYTHPQGTFSRVQIVNEDTVNPLTVNMLVGEGDITDNSVYVQSIQQIVQTVNVEDAPLLAETVLVKSAVQAIETLLQDDTAQRAALTPMGTNSYQAAGNSGVQTAVTPAANANGLIIRSLCLSGSSSSSAVFADIAAPSAFTDVTKNGILHVAGGGVAILEDFYVPAGNGIYFACQNAATYCRMTYDLL